MSLDKAIRSGKEHRRPYYGRGEGDTTCRPHGGCTWCEESRLHSTRKREEDAREQIKDATERHGQKPSE